MKFKSEIESLLESLSANGIDRGQIERDLGYSENYIDQSLSRGGNKKFLNALQRYALQNTTSGGSSNGAHLKADRLNKPLPLGNITRTLADYIAMIENYNKTMSEAISAGLISLKEGQQQLKEQIAVLGDDLNNQLEGISSGLAAAAKIGIDVSGQAPKNAKGNKGH